MENIRDIRDRKELYYVLDEQVSSYHMSLEEKENTAIVTYMYYPENAENYYQYLKEIPDGISVYIISSNPEIYTMYEAYVNKRAHTYFVKKENRGRDVSALLVAGREIVKKYKYVCFVHDKKEKAKFLVEDTELWIQNLWENTIKTGTYIENVIGVFERNDNLGLLAVPEPVGTYINAGYINSWGKNFANTKALAEKLELNCDIDIQKTPITLGTVFWCKTNAMKKLFDISWTYEDFPDEPLASDGTISHAIERILGYVAQDMGYDTGTIMTSSYAAKYISFLQSGMQQTFMQLRSMTGIANMAEFNCLEQNRERIAAFFERNKSVCLYGAGIRGRDCITFCESIGYYPDKIIVSEQKGQKEELMGIPIVSIDEIENKDDVGIIITVGFQLQSAIIKNLQEKGIKNYICYVEPQDSSEIR